MIILKAPFVRRAAGIAAAVLFLATAPTARAGELTGGCDIRFLATSTLHDISGTVRCRPFAAPVVKGSDGRARVPLVAVEAPVAGMDTGNRSRDAQMRDMFQSSKYPTIRVSLREIDLPGLRSRMRADPNGRGPLELTLRIRDTERRVQAVARNLKESLGTAAFEVEFPVSLREFNLPAPSVLGIVRVGDKVTVIADVRVAGIPAE